MTLTRIAIQELLPRQARMIAEMAAAKAEEARAVGYSIDNRLWEDVERKANHAADQAVAQ